MIILNETERDRNMTNRVKTTCLCPGAHKTTNTSPVAYIERAYDDPSTWFVKYGDYAGRWASFAECKSLIESVASIDDDSHSYPITIG